jgi:hypothetical protein
MYKIGSKDTIINEIIPHLSVAKREYKTKSCKENQPPRYLGGG